MSQPASQNLSQDDAKRAVAARAVEFVADGMRVGLGTGTTATMFIHALAEKVSQGLSVRCVASSDASFKLGQQLGIAMTTLDQLPQLDLYIDGADEIAVEPGIGLALIKGGGGALLREKIVASAADRFLVVVDSTKVVAQLGRFPLPVEVVKMALPLVQPRLEALGLNPLLRRGKDGTTPYLTDEQNYILDCHAGQLVDPRRTAADIRAIIGVVEHGLFLGMSRMALVAGANGVEELRP